MAFMILAFLAGCIISFRRGTPLYLRILTGFLLYTLSNEFVAGYLWEQELSTTFLYNIYNIVNSSCYLFILFSFIEDRRVRKIAAYVLVANFVFSLLNLFFFQGLTERFNTITFALSSLLVIILCVYYFLELFRLRRYVNLVREPSFWITVALIFYFPCSFPLIATSNMMLELPQIIMNNLSALLQLMNILLYSLFTIAFLCKIRERNST